MLIYDWLKERAEADPDRTAVVCVDRSVTYAEFARAADATAQMWLRCGLQPGDRLALRLKNSIELAICYYACFAGGFVAVPINGRLTPEEVAWVLAHSGSRACVSRVDLELDWIEGVGAPAAVEAAMLLYTSGTTARPKGVCHTARTLAGNVEYMRAWGLTEGDHTLLFTPMVHASGAIMQLLSSISIGAGLTIVPVFDAGAVLDAWEHSGATFFMALPTMVRALIAEQQSRPRHLVTGRLAISGGDAVPVTLQEEYLAVFGHPMVEGYGLTEGLPLLANHPTANRPGSMGRAVGDTQLQVVEGELWVRGGGIATGYWGEASFEGGWLKTGDLAEIDPDGFVWFRGRRKEIIVRGGSNISPQEVEEMLYRHPAVAEAGVIGVPDSWWGETVLAYVALRDGFPADSEGLIAFLRGHLAEYKCPSQVIFMSVLPKGPTGKVQRRTLKEMHSQAAAA